jgi:hypothetical protein
LNTPLVVGFRCDKAQAVQIIEDLTVMPVFRRYTDL